MKAIYLKGIHKNPKVKPSASDTVVALINEYYDIIEQSPEKRGALLKAIKRLSEKYGIDETVVANLLIDDKILGRQTSDQSEDSDSAVDRLDANY